MMSAIDVQPATTSRGAGRNGSAMQVRRSARVAAEFYVRIDGVDREPVLRRGNISSSGIYFVTDVHGGEVGMMSWLDLVSLDGQCHLRVTAYVVRRVVLSEIDGPPVVGLALEFMAEDGEASAAIDDFVSYVLALRRSEAPLTLDLEVEPDPEPPQSAVMRRVSVKSMWIETTWRVKRGEDVVFDMHAHGMPSPTRVEGRAVCVLERAPEAGGPCYFVKVDVRSETDHVPESAVLHGPSSDPSLPAWLEEMGEDVASEAIDDLLSALTANDQHPRPHATTRARRFHLSGSIARIPLTTLLALFEMERFTGKFMLRSASDDSTVYLRDGQLVDVEPLPEGLNPLDRLRAVLGEQTGSFEFSLEPVDRPDRIGVSTTALLLEFARLDDEAAHATSLL